LKSQVFNQLLSRRNLPTLVAVGQHHLPKHQALMGGKCRYPLQRCHVGKTVQATSQGLAVNGNCRGLFCLPRRQRFACLAPERLLHGLLIEPKQNRAQTRVSRRSPPL